jgi:hypothetical protein
MAITIRDSHDAGALVGWWVGAVLLLGVAIPVLAVYFTGVFPPGFSWIFYPLVGSAALAGAIVLYKAVTATLGHLRFGRLTLRISGNAPAVGGELDARLSLPAGAEKMSVELVCMELGRAQDEPLQPRSVARSVARARADGLRGRVLWSSGALSFAAGAAIRIPIPAGLPGWDMPEPGAAARGRIYHAWELRVDAALPGVDLSRSFLIEVRRQGPPPARG